MNIHEQINKRLSGHFTLYNVDSGFASDLVAEANERALKLDPCEQAGFLVSRLQSHEPAAKAKNIILQNGLKIFQRRLESVSRIVGGFVSGAITPSTFTTQQTLQSPLDNLRFPRFGSWEETNISNGVQYTFSFWRPAASEGGSIINEMAIQVVDGNNVANLNRVWSPSSGLPYTFPSDQDTLATFDLQVTVS